MDKIVTLEKLGNYVSPETLAKLERMKNNFSWQKWAEEKRRK